jgi:hypothetical protein
MELFGFYTKVVFIIRKLLKLSIVEVTNLIAIPFVFFKELKIKAKICNRSGVSSQKMK